MKSRIIIIAVMAILSYFAIAHAQDSTMVYELRNHNSANKVHDYLMPGKGKSMLELYSGIPFIAIGQYSYGFSDRFSAGIIYGYTPDVLGYGFRIKAIIAQPSESVRINLKAPFIYYPRMSKEVAEPWIAVWPTLNVEKKFKNEARLWVGVGIIGAACVDYFIKEKESYYPEPDTWDDEAEADILNTIQIGYSQPLSNRMSFVIEAAPLMQGFKFKTPHGLINNIPVFATVGLTYTL